MMSREAEVRQESSQVRLLAGDNIPMSFSFVYRSLITGMTEDTIINTKAVMTVRLLSVLLNDVFRTIV